MEGSCRSNVIILLGDEGGLSDAWHSCNVHGSIYSKRYYNIHVAQSERILNYLIFLKEEGGGSVLLRRFEAKDLVAEDVPAGEGQVD